jgi:hypothetical protein
MSSAEREYDEEVLERAEETERDRVTLGASAWSERAVSGWMGAMVVRR